MTDTPPPPPPPPPSSAPQADNSVSMQRPVIIAILYLLNFVLGFSVIVGVILAYIWRGEERTSAWEQTHYTYLIRTFWIGLAIFVGTFIAWIVFMMSIVVMAEAAGGAPPDIGAFFMVMGGVLIFFLAAAWFAVRCVLSLVKAGEKQPMPRPESWLF